MVYYDPCRSVCERGEPVANIGLVVGMDPLK